MYVFVHVHILYVSVVQVQIPNTLHILLPLFVRNVWKILARQGPCAIHIRLTQAAY